MMHVVTNPTIKETRIRRKDNDKRGKKKKKKKKKEKPQTKRDSARNLCVFFLFFFLLFLLSQPATFTSHSPFSDCQTHAHAFAFIHDIF